MSVCVIPLEQSEVQAVRTGEDEEYTNGASLPRSELRLDTPDLALANEESCEKRT